MAAFTSLMERFPSLVSVSGIQTPTSGHNLLSFLATAQVCHVSIIPSTWQAARLEVGFGGTSRIRELREDIQTNLTFKCLSDAEKLGKSASDTSKCLLTKSPS